MIESMWVIGKAGIEKEVKNLKKSVSRFFILDEIKPDVVIALGGEGTVFRAVKEYPNSSVLPVRKSSFGALSQIDELHVVKSLDNIKKGKYHIERMMRLDVKCKSFNAWGINDISVFRDDEGANRFRIFLNGKNIYKDVLIGDGVLCSTPYGSTGYNWSAGGPILRANEKKFIVTPICSSYFNKRLVKNNRNVMKRAESITVPVGKEVVIKFFRDVRNKIVPDGRKEERHYVNIKAGDEIVIRASKSSSKLLRI